MRLKRAVRGEFIGRLAGRAAATDSQADGPMRISGCTAPYDSWTTLVDLPRYRLRERYARGCFDKSIRESDVRCCFNHAINQVLGRTSNGTLRLDPSGDGLTYEVDVNPDDSMARDVWARVKRGDVVGGSTWFVPEKVETARSIEDGRMLEDDTIVRAELWEQGPVVDGA